MNCFYGYQQMNTVTSCEEMRMESVVCSKPRRLGLSNNSSMNNNHIRPLRCPISYQSEMEDSGVGAELLDIILSKTLLHAFVAHNRKLIVDWVPAWDLEEVTYREDPNVYRAS